MSDPFTCPPHLDPLVAPFEMFACRKEQEWMKHLDKDPKIENSQNPQPQNLRQFPLKNNGTLRVAERTPTVKEQVVTTFRYDQTTKDPVGVVVMFHGLNSRIGHGTHLAAALATEGFVTVGFDHRGFGWSKDHTDFSTVDFNNHMKDSIAFVNKMKQAFPNLPMFALGLSLGGLTSYTLIKQNPKLFNGAVLMAPAIQRFHLIQNIFEHFKDTTTANTNARKYLRQLDPYRYQGSIPSRHYIDILRNKMSPKPISYSDIKVPLFAVQGGCDRLVDPRVGFDLINSTSTFLNKNFYYDDTMWHNVWFDKNINTKIMPKVIKWLKALV